MESPRTRRLRSDVKALTLLREESSIFSFTATGSPPEHYLLTFRGRGVFRPENSNDVRIVEVHEIALRLGAGYPRQLPSLTWKTPMFHPNIASSGVVCLGAYGQHWAPSVTLDELCHMLWDMIRYANYDVDSPYNREAAQWARQVDASRFPLDPRPLRDITAGKSIARPAAQVREDQPIKIPSPHVPLVPATPEMVFLETEVVVDAELVDKTTSVREDEGILFIS